VATLNGLKGQRRPAKTRIPADIARIVEVRRFLHQVIPGGALSDSRVFDLEVAVSEACGLAVKHSSEEVQLTAWALQDRVVVEVSSRGESGLIPAETDTSLPPIALCLMTTLADQLQISRLSDHLTRISLTFLFEVARDRRRRSSNPPSAKEEESERERLLEDPRVHGRVITTAELRKRKAVEGRLKAQAFSDPLTGLANRALFSDRLGNALSRADRLGSSVAVALIDLDDFKIVNDSLGHAAGDRLLVQLSERLKGQLRAEDTAARLGGDEFAVLLEEGTSVGGMSGAIGRVLAHLRAPYALPEADVRVGASVGVAVRYPRSCGAEELLEQADFALYAAKSAGKNSFKLFESGMSAPNVAKLELQTELELALERDEIVAHYQPILSTPTGTIVGFEALCRWAHPQQGLLAPTSFFPVAEESGLVVALGDMVLRQACDCLRQWDALHPDSGLWFAINLCDRQLREPRMVDTLLLALTDSHLEPERLVLDINETVFAQADPYVLENLTAIREAGVRLAIDDFGSGLSSISLLGEHPVDILKMAKDLVDTLDRSPGGSVPAGAVMSLARSLGSKVVAVGVERRNQSEGLIDLGCDMWQGWHFSPAIEASQLLALSGTALPADPLRVQHLPDLAC
jgi:diguanylate cyclase (GGDEF)-like protein